MERGRYDRVNWVGSCSLNMCTLGLEGWIPRCLGLRLLLWGSSLYVIKTFSPMILLSVRKWTWHALLKHGVGQGSKVALLKDCGDAGKLLNGMLDISN